MIIYCETCQDKEKCHDVVLKNQCFVALRNIVKRFIDIEKATAGENPDLELNDEQALFNFKASAQSADEVLRMLPESEE